MLLITPKENWQQDIANTQKEIAVYKQLLSTYNEDDKEEVARLQQSLCKREEFLTALENHGRKQGWME